MRIDYSANYYHTYGCTVADCERHYCNDHRLLWRDCDTAKAGHEGSGRLVFDMGDCPACERDFRQKQWEARIKQEAKNETTG